MLLQSVLPTVLLVTALQGLSVEELPYVLKDVPSPRSPVHGTPGRMQIHAPPVSSAEARRLLATRGSDRDGGTIQGDGAEITPEISRLARHLKHDPQLLYEYVKNTIDYVPMFGSVKGATSTLLDKRGNDFDQASLLVALLRASGYSAGYILGTARFVTTRVESWLGAGRDPDVVGQIFASAGIPVTVYVNGQGNLTAVEITYVWVEVDIGGTDYVFDPTFKFYDRVDGIDLASAMNYDQATFLANATQGATLDPNYVEDLNRANIRGDLDQFATNLISHVRQNLDGASLADVVGGGDIRHTIDESFRTTLQYERSRDETWTDIPSNYETTVRIQHLGIDVTLATSGVYGKRLTLFYDGSNAPVLRLDGAVIATGTPAAPDSVNSITLTLDHPYAAFGGTYADQTHTTSIRSDGSYVIMNGYGLTGRGLVEEHRTRVQEELDNGHPTDSEQVLGETLTVFSLTWLGQVAESEKRLDAVGRTYTIQHHTLGYAGQLESPYVDIPMSLVSVISLDEDTAESDASFFTGAGLSSAFEWGIFNQTQEHSAVCTVKLIDIANQNGNKIYDATPANYYGSVRPNLINYDSSELALLDSYINAGFRLTLPEDGDLNELQWTGIGFIAISPGENSIGHIISGGLSGGFGNEPWNSDPYYVVVIGNESYYVQNHAVSYDPIELFSGSFLYDSTDILSGSDLPPLGLAFSRSYNSRSHSAEGPFGRGWNHAYDNVVIEDTDGFQGLGADSPVDAAAALVELFVAHDLLTSSKSNLNLATATVAHRWFMDRLIDNVVVVTDGASRRQFVRLPDGSFSPPPGSGDELIFEGDGTYLLTTKHGNVEDYDIDGRLSTWIDSNGNTISLTYNVDKIQSIATDTGRSVSFTFTGDHVTQVTDDSGRTVGYEYDVDGNMTASIDPSGARTGYTYDIPGRMIEVYKPSDPVNPFVQNTYDDGDRVITQANANGEVWEYYLSGQRAEEINPLGESSVLHFDASGRTILSTDALGNQTSQTWDGEGRLRVRTYPEENATEFVYDQNHNTTRVTMHEKPPGSMTLVKSFTYEPNYNRMLSVTDENGDVTSFEYDSVGNMTRILRPAVAGGMPEEAFLHNSRGQVIQHTVADGMVTTYTYDAGSAALLSTTRDSTGNATTTSFAYDAVGNRTAVTSPAGETTAFQHDSRRLMTLATSPTPFSHQTQHTYDVDGILVSTARETGDVVDPWQTVSYEYSATGMKTVETNPASETTTYSYDQADRLTRMVDPQASADGTDNRFEYDANGRITTIIDGRGQIAEERTYTENGNRATITDGLGRLTAYEYGDFDRLERVTYPDGSYEEFTYDGVGNVVLKRARNGDVTTLAYDALDRLISKTVPGVGTTTFTYDLVGRILEVTDASGTTLHEYDSSGHLTRVTRPDGRALEYAYDANGRRTRLTYPDGFFVTYAYDEMGRMTDIFEAGAVLLAHYDYDALSRRVNVTYGNGTTASYDWDLENDLLDITHTFTADTRSFTYTHDLVGNRTGLTSAAGSETYQYDGNYQLTSVTSTTGGPQSWDFTYDPLGNRVSVDVDGDFRSYSTNNLNQYTSVDGLAYTYDTNGNLIDTGHDSYTYDGENRLIRAITPTHDVRFAYDAFGRKVERGVTPLVPQTAPSSKPRSYVPAPAPGETVTEFLYDNDRLIEEYDDQGNLVRRFIYGLILDEPIAMDVGSDRYYFHADALGSIMALSSSTGDIVEEYAYDPFGAPRQGSVFGNPFGFGGRYYEETLGLYDYRARFYDPAIGRFLQVDPIGYLGGINLYGFVLNNPLNLVDPYGYSPGSNDQLWRTAGAVGMVGASFIPGVGEVMDVYTLFAPDSAWWERGLSLLSLGVSVVTLGASPNFGAAARAADDVVDLARGADNVPIRWNPVNGPGPLGAADAATFRGGSYTELVTQQPTTLYRVYGDQAGEMGRFWTREPPAGPLQSQMDLALNPAWGNSAENVVQIQVPPGTRIFEGFAAPQGTPTGGTLLGGGSQVIIQQVDPSWVQRP